MLLLVHSPVKFGVVFCGTGNTMEPSTNANYDVRICITLHCVYKYHCCKPGRRINGTQKPGLKQLCSM